MKANSLSGHQNPIYAVIAHPHQPLFYTAGNDKGIVEWSLETLAHQRIFKPIQHTVYALNVLPEFSFLVAGCNDGTLCFFDINTSKLKHQLKLGSAIFDIQFIPSKKELLVSTDTGQVSIINPEKQEIIHQFQSGNQKVRALAIDESLNLLAAVSNDEFVRIFNLEDYTLIHQFKGHADGVGSACFSPDRRFLITGGRDAQLKVWNVADWTLERGFPAHLFAIYQIIFHPTLPYFATASRDKSIKIWRAEDFSLFKNLSIDKAREGHLLSVNDICWTSDGKKILSVGDDKLVKVWEFNSEFI
jgi:WD40 repeat protein